MLAPILLCYMVEEPDVLKGRGSMDEMDFSCLKQKGGRSSGGPFLIKKTREGHSP